MTSKRKKTFVLVVPRFEDIFHSYYAGEIIKGVSFSASHSQIDVLIHMVDRSDHRGWLDSSLLDPAFIQGIIFADIDNDVEIVKQAIRKGIPAMVLNNFLADPINCIAIDNHRATIEAVKHLIKLGHKDIATIAGDMSTQAGQMRLDGFCSGLLDAGIRIPKFYLTEGDFLRTPARAAATRLLRMKKRPTAVFAASDVMALELMDVAQKEGLKIPEDLSVVGFDDNPLNINSPVPLTTVSQPLVEMGRLGVEHLKRITQGKAQLPVKIVLPAKLVVRKSTARLVADGS